ncbi:hypothetical protein [Alteromonas sp. RKMC-009]|uniref:hypothetical protein n=1 Tax=Alteromonas sp. RKMC-009 TaxID=2267264 RepID=UPI000E69B925|nr:hypothetical protein [Alteromonas sp. RKMC-009]AYA64173.1 hypothetical protein DS731_09315 [Alteromonas sp. RKMC-009]
MNAQELICEVEKQGISLTVDCGFLIVSGTGDRDHQLTSELADLLREWKPKLIPIIQKRKAMKVLRLVIDGKAITCLDPVSTSDEEAIQNQRGRWGDRLTSIAVQ